MHIKSITLAMAASLLLTACNGMKSSAEKTVRDALKDPDSAKFGEFYYNEKTKKGCLTVNAKNAMGGYTGDQQAFLTYVNGKWDAFLSPSSDEKTCREIHADKPD